MSDKLKHSQGEWITVGFVGFIVVLVLLNLALASGSDHKTTKQMIDFCTKYGIIGQGSDNNFMQTARVTLADGRNGRYGIQNIPSTIGVGSKDVCYVEATKLKTTSYSTQS